MVRIEEYEPEYIEILLFAKDSMERILAYILYTVDTHVFRIQIRFWLCRAKVWNTEFLALQSGNIKY